MVSVLGVVSGPQDGVMSSRRGPRGDGPRSRRVFTPAQKLDLLARYEQAVQAGRGGAFLREQGLYSSLISEWRRARDGGLLEGKAAGESVGRPSAQQAEIARLTRELEVTRSKLARTQVALDIMGKAHELLEEISRSELDVPEQPRRGRP